MAGLSPTQRTLAALRQQGCSAEIVERWIQHGGDHGIRHDLFGVVDVLALDPVRGFVGIQCCAGSGFSAHWLKLTEERAQESTDWLMAGGFLEIWAWRKVKLKRGSKAERWAPRVREVTLSDIGSRNYVEKP